MTRHLAGLCLAFLFAWAQATPSVMLVDSYHAGYAWSQAWRSSLMASLGGKVRFLTPSWTASVSRATRWSRVPRRFWYRSSACSPTWYW